MEILGQLYTYVEAESHTYVEAESPTYVEAESPTYIEAESHTYVKAESDMYVEAESPTPRRPWSRSSQPIENTPTTLFLASCFLTSLFAPT